ncbi:MAG: phosphoenolpyruvate synthase [Oceanobacter sp.]
MTDYVLWFDQLTIKDTDRVGGKGASLGEMISHLAASGVRVPGGFTTTTDAYQEFLAQSGLELKIRKALSQCNFDQYQQLSEAASQIREWISETPLPAKLQHAVTEAYLQLQADGGDIAVAVRSSASNEDMAEASGAGQQDSHLNIIGIRNVLEAIKDVYASLFTERAISYREHHGFDHLATSIAVGVQRMVRSETASSGVMFTIDTESGFDQVVFITSSYGLGNSIVQGKVNPDEFYVHKPNLKAGRPAILRRSLGAKAMKQVYDAEARLGRSVISQPVDRADRQQFSITDEEVETLAKLAVNIEEHYGRPMDIEWAKDGDSGELFIVQARPETVKNRHTNTVMERYLLKETGTVLAEGRSIGHRIGRGPVRHVYDLDDMDQVQEGDVLVADMTDPDWEPAMKRASAVVTNRGGRTCHAAIIARELGIPAVVGCEDATDRLKSGQLVTVSCAEGDAGYVYEGTLEFDVRTNSVDSMPEIPLGIMMNVGNPDRAFDFQSLPNAGVGLARLEFIINRMIGVHPKALLNYGDLPGDLRPTIERRVAGYPSPVDFYVEKLVEGIATLAAAFWPKRVIVRLSDFKSNEYANLIGGRLYEPEEENPMLGFRGASRYISKNFRDCFELECRAMRKVRDEMGFTNVEIMVPFVRTVGEAEQVVQLLKENGLERGVNDLRLIMMCELPANALLADQFLEYFDGFSVGSNDLTQLTLGLDRDSGIIAHLFDERNPAIKMLLENAIRACKAQNKYIGICGQGPTDHPDFAQWLMEQGVDSISFNPDSVLDTWFFLSDKAGT